LFATQHNRHGARSGLGIVRLHFTPTYSS